MIYLVAWTGGLDEPAFIAFTDEQEARDKYDELFAICEPHEFIDLLRIHDNGTIERL